MEKSLLKKVLVFGIIILFIGASVTPSLNRNDDKNTTVNYIEEAKEEIVELGDPPELVGYWSFNEGSGSTAGDSAGDNNGIIYGAAWTNGVSGDTSDHALDFDGINDYVAMGNTMGGSSGSISFWIKTASEPTSEQAIISQSKGSPTGPGCHLLFTQWDGELILEKASPTGPAKLKMGSLESYTWYHVVWLSNGDSYKGYINGVEQSLILENGDNDGEWFGDIPDRNYFRFGNFYYYYPYTNHIPYDGVLDEVRIYNRVLEDLEIEQLAGISDGLIGYWSFNDGTATDNSGNGRDGVINGATPQSSGGPDDSGYLEFDGNDYVDIPDTSGLAFNNEDFTFACWFQIYDNANSYRCFMSLGDPVYSNYNVAYLIKLRSGYDQGGLQVVSPSGQQFPL